MPSQTNAILLTSMGYDAVRILRKQLGWQEAGETDEWDIFWSDQSISLARAVAMQPMQVYYAAAHRKCLHKRHQWCCASLASHTLKPVSSLGNLLLK